MKQQSNWFTGIDYFGHHKEKEIVIRKQCNDTSGTLHHNSLLPFTQPKLVHLH